MVHVQVWREGGVIQTYYFEFIAGRIAYSSFETLNLPLKLLNFLLRHFSKFTDSYCTTTAPLLHLSTVSVPCALTHPLHSYALPHTRSTLPGTRLLTPVVTFTFPRTPHRTTFQLHPFALLTPLSPQLSHLPYHPHVYFHTSPFAAHHPIMEESKSDPVADAAKLPLSDRVVHKHWKVREHAYRELADKFRVAEEGAKIYSDFVNTLSKIVRDANAPAQLSGFDAIINFADAAPPQLVRRIAPDISKGIVEKGLAGRPANKTRASDTFVMLIGADTGELAVDALIAVGFKHRTPKVVAAVLDVIAAAIEMYGVPAVPVKPVASNIAPLLNHSQEAVRNSAKALVTVYMRWVGAAMKPVYKDAKKVIITELDAALAKNAKLGKAKAQKLTRAHEQRVRERGGAESEDEDDGFGDTVAEEEELDLAEEINLMEKLAKLKFEVELDAKEKTTVTKDWYGAVDSKKWNARKNAFDTAVTTIGEARLTPGSHHEIVTRLRKVIQKDTNVNVVASAAKLVTAMAGGLKKHFPPAASKALMIDLFGKLKEKNRVVVDAVCKALDALHSKKCLRILDHLDDISTAAGHKTPKARSELHLWLGRCLRNGIAGADLKGAPLKFFGTLFLKGAEDNTPDVRDAALSGLASLQKLVGERNVLAYFEKLDKKRQDKVLSIAKSLPDPVRVASSKPSSGPASNTRSKAPKSTDKKKAASPTAQKSPPKRAKAPPKKKKVQVEASDDEGEISQSPADVLSSAAEKFEGFEPDNWSVKSFKARAAATTVVLNALGEKEGLEADDVSTILGLLLNDPGLADSNFIAAKPKLELFGLVAKKCTASPPRKTLKPLLATAMEKLGDLKSAKLVAEMLMSFVEVTSPRYFLEILSQVAQDTKNSRALIGMLKLAGSVVEDFGMPPVPEKPVVAMAAANLANPAQAAKNGAMALACKSAQRVGAEKFRKLLEEAGASDTLDAFDSEMEKYTREPDAPTRKKKFTQFKEIEVEEEAEEEVDEPEPEPDSDPEPEEEPIVEEPPPPPPGPVKPKSAKPVRRAVPTKAAPVRAAQRPQPAQKSPPKPQRVEQPDRPLERVSISHEFSPGSRIFLDLKNSNWKKRQDALHSIQRILENANNFIKGGVGPEIMPALRLRLSDSNRNLATMAYAVVEQFVRAMGPGATMHLKVLAPAILGQGCIDIKKHVREAAMSCLDGLFTACGLSPLVLYCPKPLASLNSVVRKGFLEWLVPRLQGDIGDFVSSNEDLSVLLDPCLSCLRDRTVEVRHLADMILEQVIKSVGINTVDAKVQAMTKSVRLQLEPIIAKYRDGALAEPHGTPKAATSATPRATRERPRSVAVPRTPLHRRHASAAEEEMTTPVTGMRRPRPASARVTPVAPKEPVSPEPLRNPPLLIANDGRDARARRYVARRLEFVEHLSASDPSGNIPPLIGEEIEDIIDDLKDCCSPKLYAKMTAPANRFRMYVEAVELVSKELEENPDSLGPVADVMFRWAACRMEDAKTTPTVLVKLAGFVSIMCEVLMSSGVKVGDYEASVILPPIIEKVGSNRETVRTAMLSAILSVGDVVEDDVLLVLYTSCLRKPVSVRSHAEVSKEICRLIDKRCSAGAGIPPGVLSTIGRIAGGRDDAAGRSAAACLERAHEYFGDDLWSLVGDLTNDEAALLDDRLTSVLNGVRHALPSAPSQEFEAPQPEAEPVPQSELDVFLAPTQPASNLPDGIRNEDFRLSVAPAPPSSVLTSISDSLNAETPVKTRNNVPEVTVPQTPALPIRGAVDKGPREDHFAKDVLERLQASDREAQLSGLASIFEDLKDEGMLLRSTLGAQILLRLVRCFVDTLDRLENGIPIEDDAAVLKSFLKGVIRFAREPELLRRLHQGAVEALLGDALNAMIPQTVDGVEDWDQVRRGVNLMIVKVLESCDQNLLFTAMINLLLINIRTMQRHSADKIPALAKSSICIKSIAKVAKRGFKECRINALLRDIHVFLKANPVRRDGASSAEDQTFAMRLLKTVVNAVIEEIGVEIRSTLDLIAQPEKSQLVHYVEMTLKDMGLEKDTGLVPSEANRTQLWLSSNGGAAGAATANPDGNLLQARSELVGREGMEGLDKDVAVGASNLVSDTTTSAEPGSSSVTGRNDAKSGASEDGSSSGGLSHSAGQLYLKRLHEIQLRYGIQSKTGAEAGTIVEKENGELGGRQPSGEEARGKAVSLRERMARIRELQSGSKG